MQHEVDMNDISWWRWHLNCVVERFLLWCFGLMNLIELSTVNLFECTIPCLGIRLVNRRDRVIDGIGELLIVVPITRDCTISRRISPTKYYLLEFLVLSARKCCNSIRPGRYFSGYMCAIQYAVDAKSNTTNVLTLIGFSESQLKFCREFIHDGEEES